MFLRAMKTNSLVSWCEDVISFLLLEDAPEQRRALCSAGSVLFTALFPPDSSPGKSIITSFVAPGLHPSHDIAADSSLSCCKQHLCPARALKPWSLLPCGSFSISLRRLCRLPAAFPLGAQTSPHLCAQSLLHTASPRAFPCRTLQKDSGPSHHPRSSGQTSPCPWAAAADNRCGFPLPGCASSPLSALACRYQPAPSVFLLDFRIFLFHPMQDALSRAPQTTGTAPCPAAELGPRLGFGRYRIIES